MDESGLCNDTINVKGVTLKGQKVHRNIMGSGKDNTTVMVCRSAAGALLPPMTIYKAEHLWTTWKGGRDIPALTPDIIKMAFESTVIFPLNKDKYPKEMLDPSKPERYVTRPREFIDADLALLVFETDQNEQSQQPESVTNVESVAVPSNAPSFENLLLSRIGKTAVPQHRRKKIDCGARIITSEKNFERNSEEITTFKINGSSKKKS
ncbi:hypothetical protein PR048_024440 [Dryococelus australis]|uniref:DDE-1 domain-containing protein n=1 Tax=Dryococelus australis TaxID=614101 RepID=A0ABQ9GNP9_9NEOP|nr:hypothetical protein PR048_024440 [Dryococelus australis]